MKRLHFISHSIDGAEAMSSDVHKVVNSDYNFHVIIRNEVALYKRHIHSSNIYHV